MGNLKYLSRKKLEIMVIDSVYGMREEVDILKGNKIDKAITYFVQTYFNILQRKRKKIFKRMRIKSEKHVFPGLYNGFRNGYLHVETGDSDPSSQDGSPYERFKVKVRKPVIDGKEYKGNLILKFRVDYSNECVETDSYTKHRMKEFTSEQLDKMFPVNMVMKE